MNPTDPNNTNGIGEPQVPPQPQNDLSQQPQQASAPVDMASQPMSAPIDQAAVESQSQPAPMDPMTSAVPVAPVPSAPAEPAPQFQSQPPIDVVSQPQPVGVTPVQPPVAPVGPPQFGTGPQPAPAQKSPKKLLVLLAVIIGGLAMIGVGVWAILTFVIGGIALETYEGKNYSVLVPKEYEKEELGDSSAFSEQEKEGEDENNSTQSSVRVGKMSFETVASFMSRDDIIKSYDESLSEDKMQETLDDSSSAVKNFKKSDDTYQGFDARRVSMDAYRDGEKAGVVQMLVVFTDKSMYSVTVMAHQSDPALQRSANKILDSLKISE